MWGSDCGDVILVRTEIWCDWLARLSAHFTRSLNIAVYGYRVVEDLVADPAMHSYNGKSILCTISLSCPGDKEIVIDYVCRGRHG